MDAFAVGGVVVLASVLASATDWLFMDVLVHRFYARRPELWRPAGGAGRIVLSQATGTVASAAAVVLCVWSPTRPFEAAALAWCAGPLPVVAQQIQWTRMQPAVAASHAAGWLARLMIAAGLTGWLLI